MRKASSSITRRGFSLIEAAIVLGVVGIVVGGIWIGANAVSENLKVSKTIVGFKVIAANMQRLISRADSLRLGQGQDITAAMISAGVFPKDWVINGALKNPFGGGVSVSNWHDLWGERFGIYLTKIRTIDCINLAVRLSSLGGMVDTQRQRQDANIGQIAINITGGAGADWVYFFRFPLTIEDVTPACSRSDSTTLMIAAGYTRNN